MLKSVETIGAKDHAEAIAIFRAQVIAPMCVGKLGRGERAELLAALSEQTFTPPGADTSRCYGVPTIERWLYRYRRGGLEALKPVSRERGAALVLTDAQRVLLLQIREQHPSASAELIVSTLEHDGRLTAGTVSPNTVRRLFRLNGLDKKSARAAARGSIRRRWQAECVNDVWHADVCHGPALSVDGRSAPLRIHALLDDHSRRIIAIQACATERESEMLMLLVKPSACTMPPPLSTSTTGPRTRATRSRRCARGSASRWCMPSRTTPRHAARWSASGARCARAASITSAR
jgi:transposase